MRIARNFCLSLVAVIMLASTTLAEAGTMTLAEMIKFSDYIVVGKVVNSRVNWKRIAELEVFQVLKGDPSVKRVRFYAAPMWACDISGAEEDEIGLFFLTNNLLYDPDQETILERDSEGVLKFFITHSGRGRMIFERMDGEVYVHAYKGGDVEFPESLRYARYPDAEDRNAGLIKLEDVLSYIRKKVR